MRRFLVLVTLCFTAVVSSLAAQETGGGLKTGEYLPESFQVYPVTGEHAGRLHCAVCQFGLNPVLMVFTREVPDPDKPLGQLLKKVDAVMGKYSAVKTGALVVVLSDETKDYDTRQTLMAKVGDAAKALATPNVVYSVDTAAGPKGYNLDPMNQDVVIFYHRQKVLTNNPYGSGGVPGEDATKIAGEVEKTVADLQRLVQPGRPRKK